MTATAEGHGAIGTTIIETVTRGATIETGGADQMIGPALRWLCFDRSHGLSIESVVGENDIRSPWE